MSYQNAFDKNKQKYSSKLFQLFSFNIQSLLLLKVRLASPQKSYFICFNESPLKMVKNAFYFIIKAYFFSRSLDLCLDSLVT